MKTKRINETLKVIVPMTKCVLAIAALILLFKTIGMFPFMLAFISILVFMMGFVFQWGADLGSIIFFGMLAIVPLVATMVAIPIFMVKGAGLRIVHNMLLEKTVGYFGLYINSLVVQITLSELSYVMSVILICTLPFFAFINLEEAIEKIKTIRATNRFRKA